MKTSTLFLINGILLSAICFTSCKRQGVAGPSRSETPNLSANYDYLTISELGSSKQITEKIRDNSGTDINNKSVLLGRVLFYERKLSINNTISCGSCHRQVLAFADNISFSKGFGNLVTLRNSMSIQNPVNNHNMFWDSRAKSPAELALMPVFNHLEMGMESDEMLVTKLSNTSYYAQLFEDAFGDRTITRSRISTAIAQFVNCMFSMESKFDKGIVDSFKHFTAIEMEGKNLFFSDKFKCSQCHAGTSFSAPDEPGGEYGSSGGGGFGNGSEDPKGTANIGLDIVYKDNGLGNGRFKIPSLRNIELTGPYMHDGRFKTLDEVLEHYSHSIQAHPQLDEKFRTNNGQPVRLNFTEHDKLALISFLKTLTDYNLITNPKFSDPFLN